MAAAWRSGEGLPETKAAEITAAAAAEVRDAWRRARGVELPDTKDTRKGAAQGQATTNTDADTETIPEDGSDGWQTVEVVGPVVGADIVFSPVASKSSGKRYYVFRPSHGFGPVVACGWPAAVRLLGGDWLSRGRAPQGFLDLQEAYMAALREFAEQRNGGAVGAPRLYCTRLGGCAVIPVKLVT